MRLSPSRSCNGPRFFAAAWRSLVARRPAGPARLEDEGREDPGQDGRLGVIQDLAAERFGDQQVALVVDA